MLHGVTVDSLSSNLPLGALYKRNETTFRVFAPTADQVELHLYQAPTGGQGETLDLRHNADGTWETQARVRNGIAGSIDDFADRPGDSLNYVECHDNHTLWDRLTLSAPQASEAERRQMDRLAAAVLLTSQGIPFFQSGQEMLRSKGGDDNSYNKPDSVNEIHWADKLAQADMVDYYAGLIAMRKEHPMFRLHSKDEVRRAFQFDDSGPPQSVAYTLTDVTGKDSWKRARVIFNACAEAQEFPVPEGRWRTFVTGDKAAPGAAFQGQTVRVPGRSALVLGESK